MKIRLPTSVPRKSRWQQLELQWAEESPIGTAVTAYSEEELLRDFAKWGTPLEGQSYVWQTRVQSPTRKVKSKVGNVVTHVTSQKMKQRLRTESRKPEFGAVMRYEWDGVTREFYCQPPQIRLTTPTRRKRRDGSVSVYQAPAPYTPDILRLTPYGIYVEEWKTELDLEKLAAANPGRFYKDDDNTWRCPEREQYFATLGITFCLRSAAENGAEYVSNLEFLADYLCDKCAPLDESAWCAIERITRGSCPMSLSRLLASAHCEGAPWNEPTPGRAPDGAFLVDDVYKAIASRRLFVDIEFDDLSEAHEVIVCNSRAQLEALQFNRPVPKATSDAFLFSVDIGTEFMFQGRVELFEVSMVNAETVHYFDTLSRIGSLMAVRDFEQAMYRREITLVSANASTDEILESIDGLTDDQIIQGRNRFLMLRAAENGQPIRCDLSIRHVQRLKKAYLEAGDSAVARRRAVTPKRRSGGRRQITDAQLDCIRDAVEAGNNAINPNGNASYKRYRELSEKRRIPLASRKTFYLHRTQFIDKKAREGSRVLYAEAPATWYLHLEDKVHGGRPFHRVHIDHTQLDIFIDIHGRGGRIYRRRPWLTVVMDAETRAVLAFYLSLHAPSTVSCMMAIRAMVQTFRRTPAVIIVDNGKEFLSHAFDQLCDLLEISLQFRPAHEARFGAVIERLFGRTNTELIHNQLGNSKALQNVRKVTRAVDPLRGDHLTFPQLHALLDEYFFRDYNLSEHPAHGYAPLEYMNIRFASTGRRLTRLTPYDGQFYILTCVPPSKGGTRKLDKQRGIKIKHIWYWCEQFEDRSLRPQNLKVLVDAWDVSIAYVLLKGEWVRCHSKLLMKYRKLTAIEWRYIAYELVPRMHGASEDGMESILESVLRDHVLPDAASLTSAIRNVYGDQRLIDNPSSGEPDWVVEDSLTIPKPEATDSQAAESIYRNPPPKPQKSNLKLNYDTLSTSGRL